MGHSSQFKVVLIQLGSPQSPKVSHVRTYLKNFLGDPRVVDINPWLWKIILNCFVLPFRPAKSAALYGRIWNGTEFPLVAYTEKLTEGLTPHLRQEQISVEHAFILGHPNIKEVVHNIEFQQFEKVLFVPLFPQNAESTTASVSDMITESLRERVVIPNYEYLSYFHSSKCFIDGFVRRIQETYQNLGEEKKHLPLVFSFHGIPLRRVLYKQDIYYQHCFETFLLVKKKLKELDANFKEEQFHLSFQSRFGSEQWLGPATDEYCVELAKKGLKEQVVTCPSFVADCLETTDEIGTELNAELAPLQAKAHLVPSLNDDPKWIEQFGQFLTTHLKKDHNQKKEQYYSLKDEKHMSAPEQKMQSPPLSAEAKQAIKIIFFTLFLDLVGFSIIFPMFPALAEHYLAVDSENFFLKMIFGVVQNILSFGEAGSSITPIVMFGGILGALYSFLQFAFAPFWGALSDRIGRKPVLLISLTGLALSYLLWFFSGSFTLLIVARFVGGIMGGNISTATAVVADVTRPENRSKGMAFVGIAFALGFIIGPAMGGALSLIDLSAMYPSWVKWGVNPFSTPALLAFILSCFNIFYLLKKFKETLPPENRGKSENHRSINPLFLFRPLPFKGFNKTNIGHFLFLTAFSGMEFTLTFLAVERLAYTSMDNAYMFIFIGVILMLVQGGVVRRKAHSVGEKKMALMGLISLIPGLIILGFAHVGWMIYAGLFFLAIGSAMTIPCLTSLVSLYTPAQDQGKAIGIFRSLGALGRVIGPLVACVIYWRVGSGAPYFLGSAFLIIPILMVATLPAPDKQ